MTTHSRTATLAIDKRWLVPVFYTLAVLLVAAGFLACWWLDTMPDRLDDQQTVVVGRTHFAPGSQASMRVVVQDIKAGKPVAGAVVKLSLQAGGETVPLYEGQTDEAGSAPVNFQVPTDAPAEPLIVVETQSTAGRDRVEQRITIQREYRLLLSSDKPLYQPGQTIHMRALALSTLDLTPARGATLDFLVEDAKGNKVFRKSIAASDFGVAAADFTLADLVIQGNYKLSVAIGGTRTEKTVEVKSYVLPKFGLNVSTDRTFYLPGQRVEGVVQADYFFGKPVAGGQVRIAGSVWDVQRTAVVDLQGQTDEKGAYAFSFDLPTYFAGSGLESGQAQFALEVTVIDQAEHAEQTSSLLPVAANPLIIEAVAESGSLRPGVENVVYVLSSYPDGRPAPAHLRIRVNSEEPVELDSSDLGLTEFRFVPRTNQTYALDVTAQDEAGLAASRKLDFDAQWGEDHVLLRADRAAYLVGETMQVTAFTPVNSGSVYLDIVKAGQTLSTRSALVKAGRAEFAVDLGPDLYGTLELHAYKVLLEGTIVRDTRLVVVDAPKEIAVAVTPDKETYLPGEMASIAFQTVGATDQSPVQTALGIAIVDESVFALQRQDAGFAKLYFMLEQELLEPFYQIKEFELPDTTPIEKESARLAQDSAAKAAWAGSPGVASVQPINTRRQKMADVRTAQDAGFTRVGTASIWVMILVPLGLWAVLIASLWRSGVFKRSLVRLLGVSVAVVMGWGCLGGGIVFAAQNWLPYRVQDDVLGLLLGGLILGLLGGLLAFLVYGWVKRDWVAQVFGLLTLSWIASCVLLIPSASQGGSPAESLAIWFVLSCLLAPGAYLLLGQTRWVQAERFGGGVATGLGALAALPIVLVVPYLFLVRPGQAMMGAPAPIMSGVVDSLGAPGTAQKEALVDAVDTPTTSVEASRLRQYFPETLYWAPEVTTDQGGSVSLQIPMADSITTWRLTALASSQDGRLGFVTRGIRVFQDFFADVDLPVSLTQGDEISIPVGVYNYLPEAQEVRLEVKPEAWFELEGAAEQTLTIAANDIEVVYFPIRVLKFGRQGFQVTAWGERQSDAVRREVTVAPDGKEIRLSVSDWLRDSKELEVKIPPRAVPETPYVEVKIYPGVLAQVVEGLEKILRLPNG